jgi:hypothetical protein
MGKVGSPVTEEARMFRTSRTAKRGRAALTWLGEWTLPGPERRAARSERDAERQMRRERDNQHSNERRAAALAAEARSQENQGRF